LRGSTVPMVRIKSVCCSAADVFEKLASRATTRSMVKVAFIRFHRFTKDAVLRALRRGRWRGSFELGEQRRYRLGFHQLTRLIEMIEHNRLGMDAQSVVNCRQYFDRMNGAFNRRGGRRVALAMNVAPLDARASDDRRVAIRPVIAAVGCVGIAGSA